MVDLRPLRHPQYPDRIKGIFVEFQTQDMLAQALGQSGMAFDGRNLRIEVATARRNPRRRSREEPRGKTPGNHRRYDSPTTPKRGQGPKSAFNQRQYDIPLSPSPGSTAERPKLNLKPRTRKSEIGAPSPKAGGKSSVFGAAAPVDTARKFSAVDRAAQAAREYAPDSRGRRPSAGEIAGAAEENGHAAAGNGAPTSAARGKNTGAHYVENTPGGTQWPQARGKNAKGSAAVKPRKQASFSKQGAKAGSTSEGAWGKKRVEDLGKKKAPRRAPEVKVVQETVAPTKLSNAFDLLAVED